MWRHWTFLRRTLTIFPQCKSLALPFSQAEAMNDSKWVSFQICHKLEQNNAQQQWPEMLSFIYFAAAFNTSTEAVFVSRLGENTTLVLPDTETSGQFFFQNFCFDSDNQTENVSLCPSHSLSFSLSLSDLDWWFVENKGREGDEIHKLSKFLLRSFQFRQCIHRMGPLWELRYSLSSVQSLSRPSLSLLWPWPASFGRSANCCQNQKGTKTFNFSKKTTKTSLSSQDFENPAIDFDFERVRNLLDFNFRAL